MRVHVQGIRRNFPFRDSGLVLRDTLLFSAFGGIYGFQQGMNSGIRQRTAKVSVTEEETANTVTTGHLEAAS